MFAPAGATSFALPGRLPSSMSWREAGLPPPPSEIDRYQDMHHALITSSTPHRGVSPSPYEMQFGGQGDALEAMPMNTVTKHPKLKLKIVLDSALYEAGGSISGSLEIISSTSQRLRLGEIAIELEAFEELTSRDHSATQIFLFNRTLFQGEHLPPSNAVLPAAPVHGHWTARKGRTTFPFSFRLPATAPSSVNFAGNAHLRYNLKGTAQTWWNDTKSIVTVRSDAFVVERWHDELDPRFLEPLEAVADTHIFMGGNGAVWLEAGVMEQLFAAGGMVVIRAGVKNNTKRHISGIKVCIARRLIFPVSGMPGVPAQRHSLEPQITEVVHTQLFKGPSFEFPANEEVVVNLAVDLPRDLRTIRKTRLFEVQIVAQISAQMGNFAKDLTVEIPIYVAHPSSLQQALNGPLQPLHMLPQRSRSAMSQHGYHDYHSVSSPALACSPDMMIAMDPYGAEIGWSPAPISGVAMGPPSRPSSAAPMGGAASHHAYSPSMEQFAFNSGRLGQEPQMMGNPSASDWNAQALVQQLSPRAVSAQEYTVQSQQRSPSQHSPNLARQSSASVLAASFEQHSNAYSHSSQSQNKLASPSMISSPPTPPQSGITMSQLLSLGAVPIAGLTTIEEDSESAAGTIKSIRTMIGSVGRNDIAHFEAMVDEAQEDEERERNLINCRLAQDKAIDRVLPEPPSDIYEETDTTIRSRALEVFNEPAAPAFASPSSPTVAATNLMPAAPPSRKTNNLNGTASPARPPSAQGQGLSALESRLGSQQQVYSGVSPVAEASSSPSHSSTNRTSEQRGAEQRPSESGGLRAAAALAVEREQKARQHSEESVLRQQTQQAQGKREEEERRPQQEDARQKLDQAKQERASRMAAQQEEERLAKEQHLRDEMKERKTVDVQEQKKLNKEAVDRVAGWLSNSPKSSKGIGEDDAIDSALTPKTPSPSVLKQEGDKNENPTTGTEGLDSLGTVDHLPPSLSADLRALIDSSDARPTPKQGTAIHRHIGSRRFSGNADGKLAAESVKPTATKVSIPSAASRGIPMNRPVSDKRLEVKKLEVQDMTAQGEAQKYDVRSARGGKGGRVASVANMWASIADGTDGSLIKTDDAPILTLRPKAIRSGVSGSSALDFTKKKSGDVKKPSARDIFSGPTLVSHEAIRNQPLKTKRAAAFINTTMPKPVFAKVSSPLISTPVSPATRSASTEEQETAVLPGQLRQSRRLASDLIAKEAAKLKTGRNLQVEADSESLQLPMNGRGTTKPIGQSKLADLRSIWGS